jgi:hypothetical protein
MIARVSSSKLTTSRVSVGRDHVRPVYPRLSPFPHPPPWKSGSSRVIDSSSGCIAYSYSSRSLVRILYTVNGSPQYILARSRGKISATILPSRPKHRQYGTASLDSCMKAIFLSRCARRPLSAQFWRLNLGPVQSLLQTHSGITLSTCWTLLSQNIHRTPSLSLTVHPTRRALRPLKGSLLALGSFPSLSLTSRRLLSRVP